MLAAGWALATVPHVAAQAWQADGGWTAGLEADDNERLAVAPRVAVLTAVLNGRIGLSHDSEITSTRLDAGLGLRALAGGVDERNTEGRLALSRSWRGERSGGRIDTSLDSGNTAQTSPGGVDLLLGRTGRRLARAAAEASYRASERLTWRSSASVDESRYDDAAAIDFAERRVGLSSSWLASASTTLGARYGRRAYRSDDGSSAVDTDNIGVSGSIAWSESATLSWSIGGWSSVRLGSRLVRSCPVPVDFCTAGLVPFVIDGVPVSARTRGASGSLSLDTPLDEVMDLSAALSRDLSSGGIGVVRSDSARVGLARRIEPTLSGGLSIAADRSTALDGAQPSQRLRSFEASLSRTLTSDTTLVAGVSVRLANTEQAFETARSVRVRLAWQTAWPTRPLRWRAR